MVLAIFLLKINRLSSSPFSPQYGKPLPENTDKKRGGATMTELCETEKPLMERRTSKSEKRANECFSREENSLWVIPENELASWWFLPQFYVK
jgi:hypothetical protein